MDSRYSLLDKEWDCQKNKKSLSDYTKGSHYKAWWTHICKCGQKHEWQQVIKQRFLQRCDCPYCSKVPKKLCKCRSLEYCHPKLAREWHPTKNSKKPSEVFAKGSDKVWWLCDKSKCEHKHEWQACISERSSAMQGCPHCRPNPHKVCICNSFYAKFPDMAREWHPVKNKNLEEKGYTPKNLPFKSGHKIWWLCSKGHEYEARIADRTRTDSRHLSCVKCNGTASFGERKIASILDRLKILYITQKFIKPDNIVLKFDFYLPNCNKAIEFDGELHFRVTNFFGGQKKYERTLEMDKLKTLYCAKNGIHLLRIFWRDLDKSEEVIRDFIDHNIGTTWYSENYPI
jgi:hypothetical protein